MCDVQEGRCQVLPLEMSYGLRFGKRAEESQVLSPLVIDAADRDAVYYDRAVLVRADCNIRDSNVPGYAVSTGKRNVSVYLSAVPCRLIRFGQVQAIGREVGERARAKYPFWSEYRSAFALNCKEPLRSARSIFPL